MTLVALRLAYVGAAFDSYARTPGRRTVEGVLLEALEGEGLMAGALRTGSRTDAGVSALENVVRAELERPHLRGLVPAVQRRLPDGLWLTGAAAVTSEFDPRRASWRQYRYLSPQQGEELPAMREAARQLLGTHHMGAFARLEAGRNPERTVLSFEVGAAAAGAAGPVCWEFRVRGESFLWGQVRRMVSATLAVGAGLAAPADIAASLQSGRPHSRFGVAPAEGLLLERVHYEGLLWDSEAGGVDARQVLPRLVQAEVARDVAGHVAGLVSGPSTKHSDHAKS